VSKAFTRDDAPETPLVVPPRAPLPDGVPNYVTARGLALLRAELGELELERAAIAADTGDDAEERTRRLARHTARIADLASRVASARLVDPTRQPHDEVRFGATVTLRSESGEERRYTIVGVDEADPAAGRIAFLAPIARAVIGLREGETATLRTARGEETLAVIAISYGGE
jgi:transcription elongation factor GreB